MRIAITYPAKLRPMCRGILPKTDTGRIRARPKLIAVITMKLITTDIVARQNQCMPTFSVRVGGCQSGEERPLRGAVSH